jgi:hypothetical protein
MSREPGVGVFSTRRCRVGCPTVEALSCADASLLLVLFMWPEAGRLIAIGLLIAVKKVLTQDAAGGNAAGGLLRLVAPAISVRCGGGRER